MTDATPMPTLAHDFGYGPVAAHRHPNGGGWVADSATVTDNAYVGPDATVSGRATVCGQARIVDSGAVRDHARVGEYGVVGGTAVAAGHASISRCLVLDGTWILDPAAVGRAPGDPDPVMRADPEAHTCWYGAHGFGDRGDGLAEWLAEWPARYAPDGRRAIDTEEAKP
jgi:hypothetical protein